MRLKSSLFETVGVARSLAIYRMSRRHGRSLRAFLSPFVGPGDLAIDVGAHVGDRVAAFRALGTRVVALEPNARLFRTLSFLHGRDRQVQLLQAAAGSRAGEAAMHLNRANPTVSTLSDAFVEQARNADGWSDQVWDSVTTVALTTLDRIVAAEGPADFIKIDVEGFEPAVLAGLSAPPPALSFEITTMSRGIGLDALARARSLGFDRFRFSEGESHRFTQDRWVDAPAMAHFLETMPDAMNSGDVYCVSPGFERPLPL